MSRQEIIRAAVAEVAKRSIVDVAPASRLAEDLGLRSLARIELAVMLELRLGTRVRDEQVMTASTVGDLERTLGA